MAQITIEELYHGEQYNIMGNAVAEFMTEGKETSDVRTALELLIVKHTLLATQKMQASGARYNYDLKSASRYIVACRFFVHSALETNVYSRLFVQVTENHLRRKFVLDNALAMCYNKLKGEIPLKIEHNDF